MSNQTDGHPTPDPGGISPLAFNIIDLLGDEISRLKKIVNLWDKACDIAESHLQGYVNVGESLFNGIPKMAARIAELEEALDEISSGESSTYSDDVLTNAKMHIDYVTTLAYALLEKKP